MLLRKCHAEMWWLRLEPYMFYLLRPIGLSRDNFTTTVYSRAFQKKNGVKNFFIRCSPLAKMDQTSRQFIKIKL